MLRALLLLGLAVAAAPAGAVIAPGDVAVIYNRNSLTSTELAHDYAGRRGVPAAQVLGIALEANQPAIPAAVFTPLYDRLLQRVPSHVQAFVLVWSRPYRVDCMSVTSAFAFGFDRRYCAEGCHPTAENPYHGASSDRPFDDFGIRPAMLLTAGSAEATRQLIARGVHADYSRPRGSAYLVVTPDRHRNTRIPRFAVAERLFRERLPVRFVQGNGLVGRTDVMFYFVGARTVPHIATNTFLDGAIADHLTSTGGVLGGSSQMDVLSWIAGGATGSYGTVVEPCNFPQKFPDPPIVMGQYLNGDTLLEAYWKSVLWPGQGLVVGEPLARPYAYAQRTPGGAGRQ